jgi:hypothetical protein
VSPQVWLLKNPKKHCPTTNELSFYFGKKSTLAQISDEISPFSQQEFIKVRPLGRRRLWPQVCLLATVL